MIQKSGDKERDPIQRDIWTENGANFGARKSKAAPRFRFEENKKFCTKILLEKFRFLFVFFSLGFSTFFLLPRVEGLDPSEFSVRFAANNNL